MCIYTVKKQKLKEKKIPQGGGVRDSTEHPKIGLRRKRYRKN